MRTSRSIDDMARVRRMIEWGFSDLEIAQWHWRAEEHGLPMAPRHDPRVRGSSVRLPWRPPDAYSYAYLLGIYLGDGSISVSGRGRVVLRVSLDSLYPGVVNEVETASC